LSANPVIVFGENISREQFDPMNQSMNFPSAQALVPAMRLWLVADSVIVLIAGLQLFVLADHTNQFFAWTIVPPLTATFLGSGYWASLPLLILSSRQETWAHARLAFFGVLAFNLLTLVATLLHLERFHIADPNPIALIAAWIWLIVYVVFPPAMIALIMIQIRVPGNEPPRAAPLAQWFRLVLGVQAASLLGFGIVLFLAPTALPWAWSLTPLTGRAIAAWLVGIGIIAAECVWENDGARIKAGLLSYAIFGALSIFSLARYASSINWSSPVTIAYLIFIISMIIVGGYGWQITRRLDPA
jgi:hypothetical protein